MTEPTGQRPARKLSSGTLLVLAMLIFALLTAVGRSWLKRVGDRFNPPPQTAPAQR